VVANVTNSLGLVPGSASGAYGYRRELAGQRQRARWLGMFSLSGGVAGATLLLVAPGVFEAVVPILILVACALVAVQPRLRKWRDRRGDRPEHGGPILATTVFATGVYGGYFGAAQGVILMALLSVFLEDDWQRLNGLKNVLAGLVNGVAALLFIVFGHVAYGAAAILAAGAVVGGQVGASVGRRIPGELMRGLIIVVGVIVAVKLLVD
jgi:uncharacterized membrane protein YfcA